MPSNHLTVCHPLLLLPSIFPSIRVFSNILVLHIRWPKYWSFSFSISPSNEYSEFISFRIDCFDLFAVQGTLKSSPTPQFKSIKSSALSFLYGPFSHPYMTTGKTVALTRWTFVCKVYDYMYNILFALHNPVREQSKWWKVHFRIKDNFRVKVSITQSHTGSRSQRSNSSKQ